MRAGLDVGTPREERHGPLQVRVPAPAIGVEVAIALAFAAAVEQQHAVAMPGEHAGVLDGA